MNNLNTISFASAWYEQLSYFENEIC